MPTRELLTPSQRSQFTELLEPMGERDLVRHYTLTPEELEAVGEKRGASNRLGYAVQIAMLHYPGRPLAARERVPEWMLQYIASQIEVDPQAMASTPVIAMRPDGSISRRSSTCSVTAPSMIGRPRSWRNG